MRINCKHDKQQVATFCAMWLSCIVKLKTQMQSKHKEGGKKGMKGKLMTSKLTKTRKKTHRTQNPNRKKKTGEQENNWGSLEQNQSTRVTGG